MVRVLVLLVLVAAGVAFVPGLTEQRGAPAAYLTASVERGSIASVVRATGTVNPVLTVEVGSQISGRIADVLVGFNDRVAAGQTLAILDPQSYTSRLREAEAALKIAEAGVEIQRGSLARAQATLSRSRSEHKMAEAQHEAVRPKAEEAERQHQRRVRLARAEIASEAELTRSKSQQETEAANLIAAAEQVNTKLEAIRIAEAEVIMGAANLANARAVVEQKQAALEQARVDLERTEIKAPIDGIVIKRDINPGQTVSVSLKAETLFRIAHDLRDVEVHGKIDEADIGRVKEGQAVSFTVDAFPERVFAGQVVQVRKFPEVTQNVVTYTVVVAAKNQDESLLPGMTANLRIVVTETPDVLKVPNQALRFRPEDARPPTAPTVWVLGPDGRPQPVSVRLGDSDDTGAHLVAGALKEGQKVVVGTGTRPQRTTFLGLHLGF